MLIASKIYKSSISASYCLCFYYIMSEIVCLNIRIIITT